MKTYRNLYPQVTAWENLELAYRKARKGKRTRAPVAGFEFDRERNLIELQEEWGTKRSPPPSRGRPTPSSLTGETR